MEGTDESTELRWHPLYLISFSFLLSMSVCLFSFLFCCPNLSFPVFLFFFFLFLSFSFHVSLLFLSFCVCLFTLFVSSFILVTINSLSCSFLSFLSFQNFGCCPFLNSLAQRNLQIELEILKPLFRLLNSYSRLFQSTVFFNASRVHALVKMGRVTEFTSCETCIGSAQSDADSLSFIKSSERASE